jgi:hypothetical protein
VLAASDLLAAAIARFGQSPLEQRVAPGASGAAKEIQLTMIAQSAISAIQGALQASSGWPIQGTWPAGSVSPLDGTTDVGGELYQDVWPADLVEQALQLFDFRTYAGLEIIPAEKLKIGTMAAKYLVDLARGAVGISTGTTTDISVAVPIAARGRDGTNQLADGGADMPRVLDNFDGRGWDWI